MKNKTVANDKDVMVYLKGVELPKRREDGLVLLELMQRVTGEKAVMWGESIVGFGSYHYRYESGREGDMPMVGFSPRKQSLTLYLMIDYKEHGDLLDGLGKHKTSKACLYIKKLDDVDMEVLEELVKRAFSLGKKKHG